MLLNSLLAAYYGHGVTSSVLGGSLAVLLVGSLIALGFYWLVGHLEGHVKFAPLLFAFILVYAGPTRCACPKRVSARAPKTLPQRPARVSPAMAEIAASWAPSSSEWATASCWACARDKTGAAAQAWWPTFCKVSTMAKVM